MRLGLYDNQEMFQFTQNEATFIEAKVYRIQYPDIIYRDLVPIDTSAGEWAPSVTYYLIDSVGAADWYDGMADDMPMADINRDQRVQSIEMAAIGYRYSLPEIGAAMRIPGLNLGAERANSARRRAEEFVDRIVRVGDVRKGITGVINNQNVTVTDAPATGSGGHSEWEYKTGDQMVADVNSQLINIYVGSQTAEIADTLLLPFEKLQLLATTRMSNTMETALEFLAHANVYTFTTGKPLTIRGILNLSTAGVANTARMVTYHKDEDIVKLHYPMPHRFLPVWQRGATTFEIPGIMRVASVEIRRPAAFGYLDGI